MKSKISALMDGELEVQEQHEPFAALGADRDARETWRTYHLISDALRGGALLSADCSARVALRLAQEPALLGPLPSPVRPAEHPRWFLPSALAASIAAVAFVGWVALAPRNTVAPVPAPIAQAPQAEPATQPARLSLTSAEQDYLIAHQVYSPRNSLQGMAPYVRTVSDEAPARKP
jgi:sigma-E factor negative regulatory protein RseA